MMLHDALRLTLPQVKGAEDRGAAGVLIYSDPRDDGVTVEMGYAPYPDGPARNPSSVQRGVSTISMFSQDTHVIGLPSPFNSYLSTLETLQHLDSRLTKMPLVSKQKTCQRFQVFPSHGKLQSGFLKKSIRADHWIELYGINGGAAIPRSSWLITWILKSRQFGILWHRFLDILGTKLL